jgi:hypothetical protein
MKMVEDMKVLFIMENEMEKEHFIIGMEDTILAIGKII